MLRFHIITLFPESLESYLNSSMLKRAEENGVIAVSLHNIRDYTDGKHRTTDDRPFGGGPGMVLKAEPILRAVEEALDGKEKNSKVIITTPSGKQLTNSIADKYAKEDTDIVIIAGRYEGIDARVEQVLQKKYDVEKISIGEYVLTGGELPALVIIDAVARRLPGVLGNEESIEESRIASSEMYTRPETLVWDDKEYSVPEVLRSGNHAEIEAWREEQDNRNLS